MFTALACCVFFWGLQYKLSLYYPLQTPSHHVPMAKLLSKNEQSQAQEMSPYTRTKVATKSLLVLYPLLPFILLVLCAFSMPASSFRAAVTQPPFELKQALREAFLVRPPPVLS
jgi:hypothetical protein